tara:strand:+ start:10349 stop:10786 length:438 start_codon:yes stop_codon:yes gene_type:complete
MRTDLERDDFIALLEKLKSDDEADVLAAARDINAKMTVAGVNWDDLLMSQDDVVAESDHSYDEDEEDEDDEESGAEDDGGDDDELNPLSAEEKAEASSLIAAIRNMEISDLTKDELEEYEDDLEHGEFEQMDLRYLRALKTRLSA